MDTIKVTQLDSRRMFLVDIGSWSSLKDRQREVRTLVALLNMKGHEAYIADENRSFIVGSEIIANNLNRSYSA